MIQLGSAHGEITIGTGSAESSVNSLASSMRRIGGTMSLAITAPLLAVVGAGLKAAAGFEQSMNQVQVIAGATAGQMEQMSGVALALGRDTSFSAGEAAEGLLELAKAGLSAEESIAAIGGVLDLAAAGNLSVARAAEISANALNAFNLPASDAVRVADLLAAAANSSSVEVTDMATAFAMSSAVFSSNQQSIEDLSTAIAILGNNGIKGSDAGTSLKTMLMRLTAPTDLAATHMQALGIAVYNADGSMRSFQDIVGQLETATAGLTQEQKNQALTTIFGADAIRAANILIREGADEFDAMKESVQEAGAAQKVAEARMKGLAGAIEYAKGTIESTLIEAFLPMIDSLGGIIRKAADLIGKFSDLPEPIRNAAFAFAAVLAVAGPLLVALPMIGAVLGALLSPIGLIVLATAGLAAAWAADFGGIRGKTREVIDGMQPLFDRLSGYLEMIKGGDWSGLTTAVFADVGSLLTRASTTIAEFAWADWIDGALDWAAYIGKLVWDGFLTLLDWQVYVWKLEWKTFVKVLDWAAGFVTSLDWAGYVTTLSDWGTYVSGLAWGKFVSALTWGDDYVASLDWAGYVSKLSDWGAYVKALAWESFVSALTWGADYIQALDWAGFVATLSDWAAYVGALVWDGFLKLLDWQVYVWKLEWATFVKVLDWAAGWVTSLDWAGYVSKLSDWIAFVSPLVWEKFIAALTWGSDYIQSLDWAGFIATLSDWGKWIVSLDWAGFVAKLSEWGTYVKALAWDAFVTALDWAAGWIMALDWAGFVAKLPEWGTYVKGLAWDAFVSALTWGAEYIASLDWAGFIATLSDWGQWIASLDWTKIITTVIDWATWIPALSWNLFVKLLDWATIIVAFAWTEWISKLTWADFVAALSWGSDQVSKLTWADFVAALDWVGYIASFAWESFVSKLEWPLIAQFDWGAWIASFRWPRLPSFSWSSWISSFSWPSLPSFNWGDWISGFSWPSLPSFNWRDWIPEFTWPRIPAFPGWGALLGALGIGNNALGTDYWRGGLTLVGERGPELIELPRGSRVYDAQESQRMGGGGATTINNSYYVADSLDIEAVAWRVMQVIQKRGR